MTIAIRVDDGFILYADGVQYGTGNHWATTYSVIIPGDSKVIAIKGINKVNLGKITATITSKDISTNGLWRCLSLASAPADWMQPTFDDTSWPAAVTSGFGYGTGIASNAEWIWTLENNSFTNVGCRIML